MGVLRSAKVQPKNESEAHRDLTVAAWITVLANAHVGFDVSIDPVGSGLVVGKLCDVHNNG